MEEFTDARHKQLLEEGVATFNALPDDTQETIGSLIGEISVSALQAYETQVLELQKKAQSDPAFAASLQTTEGANEANDQVLQAIDKTVNAELEAKAVPLVNETIPAEKQRSVMLVLSESIASTIQEAQMQAMQQQMEQMDPEERAAFEAELKREMDAANENSPNGSGSIIT
jgi:hypothetical protein